MRRRVETKLIENKNSRQVTFSKRRRGLMKKAHELSVLCDIDLSLIIFSSKDQLFEFFSGDSLAKILELYPRHSDAEGKFSRNIHELENYCPKNASFWTSAELLQVVQKHLEGKDFEQLNMTEIVQLEKQLEATLRQTISRKTQLMMGTLMVLHEKVNKLIEDKKVLEDEVAAKAQKKNDRVPFIELNNNSSNSLPPHQGTLSLF